MIIIFFLSIFIQNQNFWEQGKEYFFSIIIFSLILTLYFQILPSLNPVFLKIFSVLTLNSSISFASMYVKIRSIILKNSFYGKTNYIFEIWITVNLNTSYKLWWMCQSISWLHITIFLQHFKQQVTFLQ